MTELKKGDLVRRISNQEIGLIVAMGQEMACVFWGDGLYSEGPKCDLEPILFSPATQITANFNEMVNQIYPDHMAWLREGSPGSGRFA